jgi:hypothetical protein
MESCKEDGVTGLLLSISFGRFCAAVHAAAADAALPPSCLCWAAATCYSNYKRVELYMQVLGT